MELSGLTRLVPIILHDKIYSYVNISPYTEWLHRPPPPPPPQVVLEVVRRIIEDGEEDVALICDPDQPSFSPIELMDVQDLMGGRKGAGHRLEVWPMKVDWCYLRDTAPTFVVSQSAKEVRGVSWSFTE